MRASYILATVLTLSLVAGAPSAVMAQPLPNGMNRVTSVEGVDEYRLANGLQVLLIQDDSKPTTTVNVTYRVGSKHENYGETGMAHLLEHLLFKGSPGYSKVWAEFTKRGLRANGTTWLDRTNYFASFSANEENLQWYLAWQADAMVNSFIARTDLDTEMTVVRNEMERGENNSGRVLFERVLSSAYQWHNYGKSTIGARTDVEGVNIERLQQFYRTYYRPSNATVIVTGKFDPANGSVSRLARSKTPRRRCPCSTPWTPCRMARKASPCAAWAARPACTPPTMCRRAHTPTLRPSPPWA
jgi:zinc protease